MIICVCHRVSDRDIARAARAGCRFEEVQDDLRVGTACGVCLAHARETFARDVSRFGGCEGDRACQPGHAAAAA